MARALMVVVAGPSGAGKTTCFPLTAFGIEAFNVDDRCAQIVGSYRAIPREVRGAVASECERFVQEHIATSTSFSVETTLRTSASIEQAAMARERGFLTRLRFVATDAVEVNILRVMQRAHGGGHATSEREIRAIDDASVGHLREALQVFERGNVYDSTADWTLPRLVATARDGQIAFHGAQPSWLSRALGSTRPLNSR